MCEVSLLKVTFGSVHLLTGEGVIQLFFIFLFFKILINIYFCFYFLFLCFHFYFVIFSGK